MRQRSKKCLKNSYAGDTGFRADFRRRRNGKAGVSMRKEKIGFRSNDERTAIHAVQWLPEQKPRAILQIVHGMAEYAERYEPFAKFLTEQGFLVVGHDHLGHGASVCSAEDYGYFAEKNGNQTLLKDIHKLRKQTQKKYPGIPYFILGHSMGSFLVRQYLCIYAEGLAGAVIMGTGYQPWILTKFGMGLCKVRAWQRGWRYRSNLIDSMACGAYARYFKSETGNEWLSRNQENVMRYTRDEHCGFQFTLNGYYNLFYSINCLSYRSYLEKMPKDLPILFVSGEQDPVGQFGKGVKKVYKTFLKLGIQDASCKLYPEDRHEILNEIDADVVMKDISEWLEKKLDR